ncbi:MAG: DUF1566 domain-containing protein, partial [Alistipes sp.]|nr:DUF1566 domain-containing protein [Alistipes sp.]
DVSNNTSLVKFYSNDNKLQKLNISSNVALQELDASDNQLSAINLRNNVELTYLNISNNANISVLDLRANVALTALVASGLSITDIDLTANTVLRGAELFNTRLTSISKLDTTGLGCVYQERTAYSGGMMVSALESNMKSWSTGSNATIFKNANDDDNGIANVEIIKSIADWSTKHPAFEWCSTYGLGWYLPAVNELSMIYNQKATINTKLSSKGYGLLGTYYYWSSTASTSQAYAKCVYFKDGTIKEASMSQTYYVRAILAF